MSETVERLPRMKATHVARSCCVSVTIAFIVGSSESSKPRLYRLGLRGTSLCSKGWRVKSVRHGV